MPLQIGTCLGAYEILSPLGAGGMGEVYRARDGKLNRDVALKVLPDSFADDPDRLARFKREAQVLASLNHPHIAAIYGFEDSSDTHALVLELVEGPTLADVIAGHALGSSTEATDRRNQDPERQRRQAAGVGPRGIPINDALPIARQIAEALEAAHEQGIIHRDLKPANIKITRDGNVKVLDFGLAKAMAGPDVGRNLSSAGSAKQDPAYVLSQSPTITSPALNTGAGIILGTAAYMSPEQARGKLVDRRTDIWAFGCVLFEMLTGRQTFETGETVSDAIAAILTRDPDWNALPPTTPPYIRALLRRCLQKDPQKRLPHIGVVRLEIDEVHDEFPGANRLNEPAKNLPLWRRAIAFSLTAIIAGAVAAGIAYYARPSRVTPSIARFSFAVHEGQQLTGTGRQAVAISPDGTQMVYAVNQALWLRSMSDPTARPVSGAESTHVVVNPVFSPDGQSLAFWAGTDQTIKRIAVTGGTPVTICAAATSVNGMSWGSDGIVWAHGSGISRVSPNGGQPESLIAAKRGEVMHGPQMLPGGDLLLFTVATGTSPNRWDTAHIVVQSLKSGERRTLIENGSDARYLSSGHIVYALGGVLYAVPLDLRRVQVTGGPVPVLEGVRRSPAQLSGSAHFSVANSGSLMFIPGPVLAASAQRTALALFDGKGWAEALKLPPGFYATPRISPNGKYVAFGNEDGKERSVWIGELSGESSIRRLTFGGNNQHPIWSPDGRHVAFSSDREGDAAIFWQKADGTGRAERLTNPEKGTDHAPKSWSRDGKQFLFEAVNGSSVSLWTLSVQNRKSTLLSGITSTGPLNAMFSPDGRWIVYQSNETGAVQVYVQPFPSTGAKYQITKIGGLKPVWSPDGKQIFYFPLASQLAVVTIATQPIFTSGNPVPLQRGWLEGLAAFPRVYDILPDGRRFIAVVPAGEPLPGTAATPEVNVVLNWFEELKQRVPLSGIRD